MRKHSKSRADDDTVSSTNGSAVNEDQVQNDAPNNDTDADLPKDDETDQTNAENDSISSKTPKDTKKKKKANKPKQKSKSRRSTREVNKKDDTDDDDEEEEAEYEVEKVVDSKKIKGRLHYLIRWKGYASDSDTWEPENTLSCPELINKFNGEKHNSSNNESKGSAKKTKKRTSAAESKSPSKRPKTDWDSENADANAEYEVERILEVRHKKNGSREFFIHWKGWSNKFNSWEPENNLNCSELIEKFMEKVDTARQTDSRSLRVGPQSTSRFTLQAPSSGRRLSKRHGQRQRVRYDDTE